jgi:hypothetical protein
MATNGTPVSPDDSGNDEPEKKKKKKKGKNSKKVSPEKLEEFKLRFKTLDNSRKKHTGQAISRRRADVWEMMCQGVSKVEMASILGVHRETIKLDVDYWKSTVAGRIEKMKDDPHARNLELGLTMKRLDTAVENAFQDYSLAKTITEKDKCNNTVIKGLSTKVRILQEAGVLDKAGVETKVKVEHEVSFAQRFGPDSALSELDDPASRHKVLDIAARLLKLAETPTIDANAIVKPADDEPGAAGATADLVPPTDQGSSGAAPSIDPAAHLLQDDPTLDGPPGSYSTPKPPTE